MFAGLANRLREVWVCVSGDHSCTLKTWCECACAMCVLLTRDFAVYWSRIREDAVDNLWFSSLVTVSYSKMPGNCHFSDAWLDNSAYSEWILKISKDYGMARCSVCQCNFSVRNMGEAALKSHAKCGKHKKNLKIKSEYLSSFLQI